MNNRKTPKPESATYNVDKPQHLNTPEFNSSTERRSSDKIPAAENLNDQEVKKGKKNKVTVPKAPKTDLGNGQRDKDEDEREKIITP